MSLHISFAHRVMRNGLSVNLETDDLEQAKARALAKTEENQTGYRVVIRDNTTGTALPYGSVYSGHLADWYTPEEFSGVLALWTRINKHPSNNFMGCL